MWQKHLVSGCWNGTWCITCGWTYLAQKRLLHGFTMFYSVVVCLKEESYVQERARRKIKQPKKVLCFKMFEGCFTARLLIQAQISRLQLSRSWLEVKLVLSSPGFQHNQYLSFIMISYQFYKISSNTISGISRAYVDVLNPKPLRSRLHHHGGPGNRSTCQGSPHQWQVHQKNEMFYEIPG